MEARATLVLKCTHNVDTFARYCGGIISLKPRSLQSAIILFPLLGVGQSQDFGQPDSTASNLNNKKSRRPASSRILNMALRTTRVYSQFFRPKLNVSISFASWTLQVVLRELADAHSCRTDKGFAL